MSITRHEVGPRMTQVQVYNGVVYLCGITGEKAADDITGQTQAILARIDELLQSVGSDRSKLLQVQIWLADIRYYDAMNAVWDAWVAPDNAPGRATCEARMAYPNVLVEMIATAAL
jgi:enamine deaminase RidA (YjgF/YER057c/UK114 family)